MFCKNCGVALADENAFCSACGTSSNDVLAKEKIGENYEETLKCMIGPEAPLYLSSFKQIEAFGKGGGTPLGIIWPLWMLHRKMYKQFFIFYPIVLLCTLIPYGNVISFGLMIFMCFNLRKMYYHSLTKKLLLNGLNGVDVSENPSKKALVEKLGGVSSVGVSIFIGIFLLIIIVLAAIILLTPYSL
jgi:hypothetical protein